MNTLASQKYKISLGISWFHSLWFWGGWRPPSHPPIRTHTMVFLGFLGSRNPDCSSSVPNLGIPGVEHQILAENLGRKGKFGVGLPHIYITSSRGFARGRNPLDGWSSVRLENFWCDFQNQTSCGRNLVLKPGKTVILHENPVLWPTFPLLGYSDLDNLALCMKKTGLAAKMAINIPVSLLS